MVTQKESSSGARLLAVDVGNTNTVLGLYEGATLVRHWRLTSRRDATADEISLSVEGLLRPIPGGNEPDDVIVASVVPSLRFPMRQAFRQLFDRDPIFVEPGIKTGMPILYEIPQEVGADRIVNAVAAHARLGGPCIVVDFGTATTFDVVTARGEYSGGVIVPGIAISAEALFEKAARLWRVEIRRPEHVVGQDDVRVDPVRSLLRIPFARGRRDRPDREGDGRRPARHRDRRASGALRGRLRADRDGRSSPDADGPAADL